MIPRSSGILLHITSLAGNYGIGTLGECSREFIDFLHKAGQKVWQILPTGPTGYGDSPYQTFSAFAGNPLLLDLMQFCEEGLLSRKDTMPLYDAERTKVDYGQLLPLKYALLHKAWLKFKPDELFHDFCQRESFWLDDFSLFMAIKNHFQGASWLNWNDDIRLRQTEALDLYRKRLAGEIEYHKFLQYKFSSQWQTLKDYAAENSLLIMGDLPIFIAQDSADAWSHPDLFLFDDNRRPTLVAGVPPDFFSATGQLWGNPLYDWKAMEEDDFDWWIDRIRTMLAMVDLIRIDHFRGFAGYWAVPAGAATAEPGSWKSAPGEKFFTKLKSTLGDLPIIAEDLGVITPDVVKLRDDFHLPGMKILQFAFGNGLENPFLPHNYNENCVAYTGTHDNDTLQGWFEKIPEAERAFVREYLHHKGNDICWAMISAAWSSPAFLAIAPMQDFLCLGSWARMNTPGQPAGNWQWKMKKGQLSGKLTAKIHSLNRGSNR
ncbi:MAG: 4-alpha-glucanotransferase [Candidatus Cloacimonetes bacterium]|nr:4-alpha-glucanotransferase [Candidatus Cloacimonadota bacterium]